MSTKSMWKAAMLAGAAVSGAILTGCTGSRSLADQTLYGRADDRPVHLYTLTNSSGAKVRITNYGGIVTECWMPDAAGNLADVAAGFDTLAEYQEKSPYFGAMVGRVGNRIAKGRFTLDGQTYQLATNNGENHLHGGLKGFDKVVWDAEQIDTDAGPGLRLTYTSPDGEEGYPGSLHVTVQYILTQNNTLNVITEATADEATPVNIVHHSYWNLDGHDSGTILGHELMVNADRYTPTDNTLIPTGIASVAGTPFDFRTPKTIGRDIGQLPGDGADNPGGYDLNFIVRGNPDEYRLAARAKGPGSGRVLEVWSNQPGVQFYSGNFLDNLPGKRGTVYPKHGAFCLETQTFPDSVNHQGDPGWPAVILRPGETYRHVMVHVFTAE
jgi:aldose 1-epimerase